MQQTTYGSLPPQRLIYRCEWSATRERGGTAGYEIVRASGAKHHNNGSKLEGASSMQDASPTCVAGGMNRGEAPPTTDEKAREAWPVVQKATSREVDRLPEIQEI